MDSVILAAQAGNLLLLAIWLGAAVRDNISCPDLNRRLLAEVLALERLSCDYPQIHVHYRHRAITGTEPVRRAFAFVVLAELAVAILLLFAALGLAAAALGEFGATPARVIALAAAFGFTLIWAGFLIVGNHFVYWMCHEGAQATHHRLLMWGLASQILLITA